MSTAPFPQRSGLERHLQTIMIAVIIAALFFTAKTMYDSRADSAVVNEQLRVLTQEVVELRSDIKAMQGSYVSRDDFRDHENRIRALEAKARK